MSESIPGWLVRNDLKVISVIMVLTLLATLSMEVQSGSVSKWKPDDTDGGDGNGQTGPTFVEVDLLDTSGHTSEGATSQEDFESNYPVVTKVEVELTWTDDIGNNDEFRLTLFWEGAEEKTVQGTSGTLSLEIVSDPEGVYSGNFTVEIEAVDCPGVLDPIPMDRDNGNNWDLVVKATVSENGEGD